MTDLWTYLKETTRPIVLYGTGNGADKIIARLAADGTDRKIAGIFASPGFVRDRSFHGIKVRSYEEVRDQNRNMIVLLCFGSSLPEVMNFVDKVASENELYAPAVPVYGDDVFDAAYFERHMDEINAARELMADELSLLTFDNTISYYLTGDIKLLTACETREEEEYGLTKLPSDAVYLDLGAYTGDTVAGYRSVFPSISKVIAVEPDAKNFRKLSQNVSDATLINALISDTSGTTHINLGKGRGVHEQDKGTHIDSVTVDSILNGGRADLIKYDVEGNEYKALTGSSATIGQYGPVLHVACYHRSEDIYRLPLLIHDMRPEYKFYLRHRKHLINWDTQFIIK